ncbi:hypothetical protein [Pseudocitrobacter corydidari]|uniref:Lipoprotein n=1 Tax=Pseudocitrobacter corydidari TaxID=2891570 RepID=A0ABY3S3W3_9ENTR|nr:hypothetical protein [Pseudocitrobacter corydidari]UGS40390.1 hypothetical protein G163CM_10880 [Pseudocitrobacter corydidari]
MKKLFLVAGALFLSGCVNNIPSKYDHSTVKGCGMSKSELVAKLGIPSRTMKIDDNITTYQWDSNQGNSSTNHSQSNSLGGAYGQSQHYYGGETDSGAIGSSVTFGDSSDDITTHVCAYSAGIDNKSNKVVSADLVGTVDNKCLNHFENMLSLDNKAVVKHNDVETHNANVHDYAAWWLLMPIGGLFVAIHNHHAVATELEPVR